MPRIRSDDGPRKLRAVWLGPKGKTLPFEWTYVQWVVCLAAANISALITLIVLWVLTAPIYGIAGAVMYGVPAGFYIGTKLMRGVSYDEPIRYRLGLIRDQLRRGRDVPGRAEIYLSMPEITDLSPGARRAIGWAPDPTVPTTPKEPNVPPAGLDHPTPAPRRARTSRLWPRAPRPRHKAAA